MEEMSVLGIGGREFKVVDEGAPRKTDIGDAEIVIMQGVVEKGRFTVNAKSDEPIVIQLDQGGGSSEASEIIFDNTGTRLEADNVQDAIEEIVDIIPDDYYILPSDGIPKSDLNSAIQTSLDKADTALQSHQSLDSCVKTTRKVNKKALSTDITIDASDVPYYNGDIWWGEQEAINVDQALQGLNEFVQTKASASDVTRLVGSLGSLASFNVVGLTSSDNLNNCTRTDTCYRWSSGTKPVNCPSDGCTLFNIQTGWGVLQIAVHYHTTNCLMWRRINFVGTWGSWKQM